MSTPRYCGFWKSSDGKWWLDLAVHEYPYDEDADEYDHSNGAGEYEDSITYGPFRTQEEADDYLSNFSNPGSFGTDDSGKRPSPKKSPNGSPVVSPGASRS